MATGNDPSVESPDSTESDNSSDDSNLQAENFLEERIYSYIESEEMIMKNHNTLHAFTIALALSVHSIFEGLAFGLQDTITHVCKMHMCMEVY